MSHFIDLLDWDDAAILSLLAEAAKLKKARAGHKLKPVLAGRVLGLLFEKPSLRTRVSFQAGMSMLGGSAVFLSQQEAGLNGRESVADVARTISEYVDAVVLRVFHHALVEEFARWSRCPVINGLSDLHHPCQALGDLLTMAEALGDVQGKTVVFVGDGNNVSRSLAIACGKVGARFILCAPKGYGFSPAFVATCQEHASAAPEEICDPKAAVRHADIIYTDVWASMGQEAESAERKKHFTPYQVNAGLLKAAPESARVMHCLPARRGEEITDEVLDGPQSLAFPQAGNRMHAQNALLVRLMR